MRFKSLALGAALCGAALLTACGGGGSDSSTNIRLLNASVGYSSLDLTVDDKTVNSNVAYAAAGTYASVSTSDTASQVQASGVGTAVSSTTPTLTSGSDYTMIAYGWAGAVKTTLLQESADAPDSGKSKLLVLNLAPDAGALDVYVTNSTDTLENSTALASSIAGGSSSGYNSVNSGTYRVRLTGYNNKADLRLDIPSITLDSAGVSTLIITATTGGVLVNGMIVKQKGAVTNLPNTLSRARVVAAVSGNATVAAQMNGSSVLIASKAPTIGDYKSLASGATTLGITVNGAAMSVSAPNLTVGGDYTLLVWGDAAAPQLSVLADDNRLPTVSGNAKIRLVNGLASAGTSLTMTLDYTSVATNVLPGTASTPTNVTSTTSSLLDVNAPTSSIPIFSKTELPVLANSVYSVFMMGDSPGTGILRRER